MWRTSTNIWSWDFLQSFWRDVFSRLVTSCHLVSSARIYHGHEHLRSRAFSSILFQHHPVLPVLYRGHCCPTATFTGLAGHSHALRCCWLPQRPCSITLIPEEMQQFSTSFSFPVILTSLLAVCSKSAPWAGWAAGKSPQEGEGDPQKKEKRHKSPAPVGTWPQRW